MNAIVGSCLERDDIFIVSGDAGLGVFDEFKKQYPDRFLNLGVAEQNAISFSAGLSLTGHKVFFYNIIPFVLYRCYEQVRNDICYQELPVVLVGIGSGVTYAPQGMTHYAVEDLGLAQTLPNLSVFSPIDPIEAKLSALYSLGAKNPVYVRMAKSGEEDIHKNEDFDITKPQLIEGGTDIAFIFHGSIGPEVLKAAELLRKENIHPKLISVPMLQPLNTDKLFSMLKGMRCAVTIEEHFVGTGLGSILAKTIVKNQPEWKFFSLGIPDNFIHEVKKLPSMRKHFGISGEEIARFAKSII